MRICPWSGERRFIFLVPLAGGTPGDVLKKTMPKSRELAQSNFAKGSPSPTMHLGGFCQEEAQKAYAKTKLHTKETTPGAVRGETLHQFSAFQ